MVSEDEKLSFEHVLLGEDIDDIAYQFKGDTLILTMYGKEDGDWKEQSLVLTGGRNGELHSVWRVQCKCTRENDVIQCSDEQMFFTQDIFFGKNQLVVMYKMTDPIEEKFDERNLFDDYMNSFLLQMPLEEVLGRVGYSGYFPHAAVVDVTEELAEILADTSITVLSKTKTEMRFSVKGREYTFKISYVKIDSENDYETADMSVNDGNFTCSIHMEWATMNRELCVDENYKYATAYQDNDADGRSIRIASQYWNSNEGEFRQCFDSMKNIHRYGEKLP